MRLMLKFSFLCLPAAALAALLLTSCASASDSGNAVSAPAIKIINRAIYVSLNGDDKNDGLKSTTPLRSPQKAANMSEPGDVIFFMTGEYVITHGDAVLTIKRSGAPGKPILYTPAPGARVIFRNNGAWDAIKITGARHIELRGFRVIGNAKNVTLDEAMREMNSLTNSRTCGNGIAVDQNSATKTPSAYITVRNCEVSDCSGGGILASHTDYLAFENNTVYRCAFWSPYGNSGISVYQPTAIDDFTEYKIFIRNNVCFENYQNIPFFYSNKSDPSKRKVTDGNGIIIDDYLNSQDWGGGGGKPYPGRTLVANNVVFANGGSGIHSYKSSNVDIVHNYAVDNNRHPDLKDGQIFANATRNARIVNNIMIAPAGKPASSSYKNLGLMEDYNLLAALDGSAPKFDGEKLNNIIGAPGLELVGWDLGKRQFNAKTDSPLRGAGLPLTYANADFFGKVRNEDKPDIGPFVLGKP